MLTTALGIILALASTVEGNQRIVQVSEFISGDVLPDGEGDNKFTCCVYGNCTCNSLDHALTNLTSNVLINITTDVVLPSLIKVSDLANVSIIGHDIPTVNCRNIGGIHFAFCHNCIFQSITWDGCGNHNEPGLKLTYSSNITIQNCVFQYSIGQVVVLTMSKDVHIGHCSFVNNEGVCIYVINQCLHFKGKILFQNNTAKSGPGIQVHNHSTVIFNENSDVSFIQNFATSSGGAMFLRNNSSVLFDQNSLVVFNKNNAVYGATIYSEVNSNITFTGTCKVTFQNNFGNLHGPSVHSFESSQLLCMIYSSPVSNSQNLIKDNYLNLGTIYLTDNGYISFEGNSFTAFYNNTASTGGAIFARGSNISFKDKSTTKFYNNTAVYKGGAIGFEGGTMSFENNSTTEFYSNTAMLSCGGAIYSDYHSYISFKNNSTAVFNNNSAVNGGGISCYDSLSFEGNSFTQFYNNRATNGGAVAAGNVKGTSNLTFSKSSTTNFYNNFAILFGGAVYSISNGPASFKDNSSTRFINNTAYDGGALYSQTHSYVSFRESSYTIFVNNIVRHHGGAIIFAEDHSDISFSDNSVVTFNNNKTTSGAIVYSFANSKIISTGNSSVIINDLPAKWCTNACLPYTSQSNDIVLISSEGLVWCSNQKSFVCQSEKCYCKNLEEILVGSDSNAFTITDKVLLSSFISLQYLNNVLIVGHNKLTVICVNDGGLYLVGFDNLTIEGITWIMCGGFFTFQPVLRIDDGSNVMIRNCSFQYSLGAAISVYSMNGNINISHCNFTNNNHYTDHGSAITVEYIFKFWIQYPMTLNNCIFSYNGPAKSVVYIGFSSKSIAYKIPNNVYFTDSNFCNNKGASIYVVFNILYFTGEVLFKNNMAESGAGIYTNSRSTIIFDKNSNVKFINNSADYSGAAIFINTHSTLVVEHNSIVEFINNKATNGTVYSYNNSKVVFAATCQVIFSSNSATQYGGAIYSSYSSYITFTGSSEVTFNDNTVSSNARHIQVCGNIFSATYSHISFEENSVTVFNNNIADFGAAMFSFNKSSIRFVDRSRVVFTNNIAHYCGVLTSALYSSVTFNGNAEVTYDTNLVSGILHSVYETLINSGGAMCAFQRANVMFSGHSSTAFINNRATRGGAAVFSESNVIIQEHATVKFDNNIAEYSSGGAIVCFKNSTMVFKDYCNAIFHGNKASQNGGAVHSYDTCYIKFKGNATSHFINNTARDDGGALFSSHRSEITFEENATVLFEYNLADNGGTFYFIHSAITFTDSSIVLCYSNIAKRTGGVGHFVLNSNVMFGGTTTVNFNNNKAEQNAGVLYFAQSSISCKENSILTFSHNTATLNGGALCFDYYSNVTFSQYTNLTICCNRALYGGAVLVNDHSNITMTGNSVLAFVGNSAAQYGGAIFLDTTALMIAIDNYNHSIKFEDNIANILGDSLYQKIELCKNNCLIDRVVGISNEFIATPPNELKFDDPAVCIDNDNDTQCNCYYVQNIMLGTEIVIPACVLDYYNHSVDSTQFLLQNEIHTNYYISGPKQVLISCDALEGISIVGNKSLSKSMNFTIKITLNTVFNPDWKQISVKLIIGLSPCHPGFWQYPKSKQCECYNASDIVFCSGSSSTIKRGYWFGVVTGKPTVTFCPINYCNFTCCETSNGYYHLSPVRDDQCVSHRTGAACGSCANGYTLSFDSTECVNTESCTAGQTVLVILLTLVYWIVIVALVFGMMYYKIGIWYLYGITYYYSIVDILLNQNFQASRGLYITVNVMSSFSKITPQFLGELCLTTGMSGIALDKYSTILQYRCTGHTKDSSEWPVLYFIYHNISNFMQYFLHPLQFMCIMLVDMSYHQYVHTYSRIAG